MSRTLASRPGVPILAAVALAALAVLAALDDGRVLLHVDRPVTRWVVDRRVAWLDDVMVALTHLGDGGVVLGLGIFLAVVVAPQHRTLAVAVAVLPAVRPFAVDAMKWAVGRDRPAASPLTDATSLSFPSGHVVAAAMWFLVPIVLGVLRPGSRAVPWAAGGAALVVLIVAATRVYLGVHWLSDVVGGALVGLVVVTPVAALAGRQRRTPSAPDETVGVR